VDDINPSQSFSCAGKRCQHRCFFPAWEVFQQKRGLERIIS
jgi:hypothetical protein